MSAPIHDVSPLVVSILLAGWAFLHGGMALDPDDLEALLRAAIRNAMVRADLTVKVAAGLIGRDESDLRKALRGDRRHYLPFIQIVLYWPFSFWFHVTPELLAIIAKRRMQDLREDLTRDLARGDRGAGVGGGVRAGGAGTRGVRPGAVSERVD